MSGEDTYQVAVVYIKQSDRKEGLSLLFILFPYPTS